MRNCFSPKNKTVGTISVVVVLCLILCGFLINILLPYLTNKSVPVCIFDDISECDNIKNSTEFQIQKYETPDKDSKLNNLEYSVFHAAKYVSDDVEFELFAYEFKDKGNAKQYFKNVAEQDAEKDTEFLGFGGATSYTLVVIDDQKAYSFYTDIKDRYRVLEVVNEYFSIPITE